MSDYAIDLLKAIEGGEQETMSNAFNAALSAKVADAIEAKKIEIASQIYSSGEASISAETGADDVTVDDLETETVTSENGTEEV